MKDIKSSDAHLIFEAYEDGTGQRKKVITEGLGDGGAEARYDDDYRKAERAKMNEPGHRELQQRMQTDYNLMQMNPDELVKVINTALPAFLEINKPETEGYDVARQALFNAAAAMR